MDVRLRFPGADPRGDEVISAGEIQRDAMQADTGPGAARTGLTPPGGSLGSPRPAMSCLSNSVSMGVSEGASGDRMGQAQAVAAFAGVAEPACG
jgi:hypothetical protein